jgi:hypothetical protein
MGDNWHNPFPVDNLLALYNLSGAKSFSGMAWAVPSPSVDKAQITISCSDK